MAKVTEILEDINDTRQSSGLFAAIAQTLTVIGEQFFFKNETILFVRSVEEPLANVKIGQGVTVRELRPQDLALFETVVERSDVELYRLLLRGGWTGLIALKEGQLAAYVWLTPQIDPYLERIYVPLAPGDIYVSELRTIPAFRRQGFQKILLKYVIEWAQKKGYSRIVSMAGIYNDASIKLHNKLGYQPISRMTRTKILLLLHFRYSPNLFGKAGNVWILYR